MFDFLDAISKLNEIYLSEGTHYDKKAAQKLADSGLFSIETSTKIVDALFNEDIHAFVHSPAWLEKYLVGIVNMLIKYCNGDASKAQSFLQECPMVFDDYLTYVKSVREKMSDKEKEQLDKKFNEQMTFEDVKNELEKLAQERSKKDRAELANKKFENSDYTLVPIDSYEQMHELFGGHWTGDGSSDEYAGGGGTAWCHTNSKNVYNSWVSGKNKFFVLAKNNWKDIPFNPETNAQNPKDEYGNSLIAILVDMRGNLKKATLRCNHVGVSANADNQYTSYSELSEIAGFNVQEEVFKNLPEVKPLSWENFDGTRQSLLNICDEFGIGLGDIERVDIPDNVTQIIARAFSSCVSLKEVNIPDITTSIGDSAFEDCRNLPRIDIPDSVISIGNYAFDGCKSLSEIDIPDSVTDIGQCAFRDCE